MGSSSRLSYTCDLNIQLNCCKFVCVASRLDSCRNYPISRMKIFMTRVISIRIQRRRLFVEWMEKDFSAFRTAETVKRIKENSIEKMSVICHSQSCKNTGGLART